MLSWKVRRRRKNGIYKIARIRESRTRDLERVMCITDENEHLSVKEGKVKDRYDEAILKTY